jgi:SH3-like domain-containing protein
MRSLHCRFALIALLLSAPHLTQGQPAAGMVSVAREEINLRAGPGTNHDALWLVGRGYPLEVIGRRGDWIQVRDFEADSGWVYRPLVARDPHFVVKATVANVRSEPRGNARIVGKARYGDVVKTVERRTGWVKVRHPDGLKGWISRQLLWGW